MKVIFYALLVSVFVSGITYALSYFKSSNENLIVSCKKKQQAFQRLLCLKPYFEELTYNYSPARAIKEAQNLQKSGIIDDCHIASHLIGEANLAKNKYDPGKAFTSCSMGCIDGCYHGVMEAYIAKVGDFEKVVQNIGELCRGVSDNPWLKRQCLHGVGHGLLRHNPEKLLEAIALCRTQGLEDPSYPNACLSGVFMENMDNYILQSEEELIADLPFICKPVIDTRDQNLISGCIGAIGEELMFYTGHNLEKTKKMCGYLSPQHQASCIGAATKELSNKEKNLIERPTKN